MRKNKFVLGIGVLAIMFSLGRAFDLFAFKDSFESVSAEEAVSMVKTQDVVVLDVRTPQEYSGPLGHIKGALLVPVQELGYRINELEQYKDKTILVVCRSGVRSKNASRYLVESGFTKVINVGPGMEGVSTVPGAPLER